jgi:DNA-binding transcriptional regulator GbsR (MarR family)
VAAKSKKTKRFSTDQELLDYLKETIAEQIQHGKINLKVGDLLKILEIQKKLSSDSGAQERFWEIIEQIRQEELKRE